MDAPAPSELDLRMAALAAEYELTIAAQARRAATLAAELAATQAERDRFKGELDTVKAELAATQTALDTALKPTP